MKQRVNTPLLSSRIYLNWSPKRKKNFSFIERYSHQLQSQ